VEEVRKAAGAVVAKLVRRAVVPVTAGETGTRFGGITQRVEF